jgi:hypothetical protein
MRRIREARVGFDPRRATAIEIQAAREDLFFFAIQAAIRAGSLR